MKHIVKTELDWTEIEVFSELLTGCSVWWLDETENCGKFNCLYHNKKEETDEIHS